VSALEIVTAAGEVVKLSRQRDGEVFLGTVVGLGALGVITKVTLDIQPTFLMRQYVYVTLPLAEMKDHLMQSNPVLIVSACLRTGRTSVSTKFGSKAAWKKASV